MKLLTDEQVQAMLYYVKALTGNEMATEARLCSHVRELVADREQLHAANAELRAVLEAVRPKIAVAVQVSSKLLPGYASLSDLLARIDAVLKNGKG